MASQVTLKALGLNYSPNNLSLPEGSLITANDVIVRRDNVIESRRGFREYSQTFGAITDRSKQLISYKDRILNHYSNILQYDTGIVDSNGKAIFANFFGSYSETDTGLRIKSAEANKNLYFTTSKGIKKISATSASDFTTSAGFIKDAGAVKALDFSATLVETQGSVAGFLPSDSAVAYRTLWGYKDANENLILGAPSDSVSVYNYLDESLILDIDQFCSMLDDIVQSSSTYYSVFHNIYTKGSLTFPITDTFSKKFGVNFNTDSSTLNTTVIDIANYMDQFALLADTNAVANNKPLQIDISAGKGFSSLNGIATIDFTTDPSKVFSVGDKIEITGAVDTTGNTYTFPINKIYTFTITSAIPAPTFSTFSSNGQTFKIMPFTSLQSYVFNISSTVGTGPTSGDTYSYTDPTTGYTYTYKYSSFSSPNFTVLGYGYPTSSTITLTKTGGTGIGGTITGLFNTASAVTTLIATGTGSPVASGAGLSGTLTYTTLKSFNITNISVASSTTITTASPHGLYSGESVVISGTNSTPTVNGTYVATVTGANTFTVPVTVTVAGNTGSGTNSLAISPNTLSFSSFLQSDPAASNGATYTNNGKTFTVTSFANYTTLVSTGTGAPSATGVLTLATGTGSTVLDFPSFSVNTLTYTSFNNSSTSTTSSPYWTITSVNSTTKQIQFNLTSTTLTLAAGTPGTATQIVGYNYRYITQTGDNVNSIPVNSLAMSSPPTHEQLFIIQHTLFRMISRMKAELEKVISPDIQTNYVASYSITTAANARLKISIPTVISGNKDYFYQIYRTRNFTANANDSLVNITPDDEMRLVCEGFPTDADFTNGYIEYLDQYPESLRDSNVNLYTNPVTGEGIAQANDIPPIAKDINVFKSVTFFSNTKTRHRLNPFQLQGTSAINDGDIITISNGTKAGTQEYEFNIGSYQSATINITSTSLVGYAFYLYSANNETTYYVWYRKDNTGTGPSITPVAGSVGIVVNFLSADTIDIIRDKTVNAINAQAGIDFVASAGTSGQLIVTNINLGLATASSVFSPVSHPNITISNTLGSGEDVNKYYIFNLSSPSTITAGSIYSNNLNQYKATTDITAGSTLTTTLYSGSSANTPDTTTVLTKVSGTGPSTISFSAFGITLPQVLLSQVSSLVTAGQAIDQTARSLVRVINAQSESTVNAYYVSSATSLPGQINLESKVIDDIPFYIQSSSNGLGTSFNPNIDPVNIANATITRTSATKVTFTFPSVYSLTNGTNIMISDAKVTNLSGTVQYLNGIYPVSSVVINTGAPSTTFTIDLATGPFVTASHPVSWSLLSAVSVSNNETKPNRIYYSKLQQPESVPLLNYFDVGSANKEILRIFPLRDSLFVFKEDGLYRVSGETAPFVKTLFDSSCILIAPDTVSVANNIIYGWTNKGISNITEAGVTEVSRPIDTVILKLASANYPNFPHASWGLGYDSDNSYVVYTCANTDDTVATVGFRFSNLTNTWTNFQRSQTCGVVNLKDDKIYTGSGTYNLIDQERKNFDRTDYADRDFNLTLNNNFYRNERVYLPNVDGIEDGDVITQTQGLTVYKFNSLMDKLDLDASVGQYGFNTSSIGSTTITINTLQYGTSTPLAHNLATGNWINIDVSNTAPNLVGTYQITVTSPTSFTINISEPLTAGTTGLTNSLTRNYSNTFEAVTGDNLRSVLVSFAAYLDTDPSLTSTQYSSSIANYSGNISAVTAGVGAKITKINHGLKTGRIVTISGTDTNLIPQIAGTYSVTVLDSDNFTIPVTVTTGDPSVTPGTLTFTTATNSENTADITACYNIIIGLLNETLSGTSFKNYKTITDETPFEAVILTVNKTYNYVTLNLPIQLVKDEVTIYKAIPCDAKYAPIIFGDPLTLKQVYEATLMFSDKAFTKVTAGFSSDLKPEVTYIDFYGQGNGTFGSYSNPGFGFGFFGGASNSAPCRTIIPRQNQRCRYINMTFDHKVARELWALYGVTLTFNPTQSTRGYR